MKDAVYRQSPPQKRTTAANRAARRLRKGGGINLLERNKLIFDTRRNLYAERRSF
jgi:hypothetical protein